LTFLILTLISLYFVEKKSYRLDVNAIEREHPLRGLKKATLNYLPLNVIKLVILIIENELIRLSNYKK